MKSGNQFSKSRQISRAGEPRRRITGAQHQKEEDISPAGAAPGIAFGVQIRRKC